MAEPNAKDTNKTLLERWPAYAWAMDIPEIRAVLSDPKLTDGGEVEARIQNTNWYKTTFPAVRQITYLKNVDPAGWAQQRGQKSADIWDMYTSIGLKPDPKVVTDLAEQALSFQWTNAQIRDAVVAHFTNDPTMLGQVGEIQTNTNQIKQLASDYFVQMDDVTAHTWAASISNNEHTLNDYMPLLQQMSKSKYPTISNLIDQGIKPKDFAASYQAEAAKILELPDPKSVDVMNDPRWSVAMDYSDPKTGQKRPMTISEWQVHVRGQDSFGNTKQANQQTADLNQSLLQTFGKVAS